MTVGIDISYSSHNRISNCTFLYNDDEGICLNQGSNHNIVENCVFANCCDGIELQNSSFNIINNCTMRNGVHNGISITYREPFTSNNNTISNCNIYNNQQGGIYLNNAYNNIVNNCSLDKNQYFGIYVSGNKSYNNYIFDNIIYSNIIQSLGKGLQLGWSCHNNTFYNNHILNYNYGVYIENTLHKNNSNNNLFYHNKIIANTMSAYDECTNIWDNGYPIGGNYWDDYFGKDNNGDGFGDIPYNISGRDNKDNYPLIKSWNFSNNPPNKPSKPTGQTKGKIGQNYKYSTSTTDPDGDQVYYTWDWGDDNLEFAGPYYSGLLVNASHSWTKGSYTIRVQAKDIYGFDSEWSDPLTITMPRTYIYNPIMQLFMRILEHFSIFEKILNQILI